MDIDAFVHIMFNPKRKIEMTKKTNMKKLVRPGKSHTQLPLLDLLKEHSSERTSKLEAYLELVDLASVQYVPKDLRKEDYALQPNQFVTTITELADCWHWHRATVRTFIEQLEAAGQISVKRLTRSQIISVPICSGDCGVTTNGGATSSFMQKIENVLSEWANGGMTAAHCGSLCEQLYADAVSESATKDFVGSDGNISDVDKANVELCRAALKSICLATFKKILAGSSSDGSELLDFFKNDLGGDWQAFIEAAKVLSELILDGESASLDKENAAVKSQFRSFCKPFIAILTGNGNAVSNAHCKVSHAKA